MTDEPIPLYKKITAAVVLVALVVAVFEWHSRVPTDFWPLDRSTVGPNIVASILTWGAIAIGAALIWPPTRKRMHRFVDKKLSPVHDHLKALTESHKALHDKIDAHHKEHLAAIKALAPVKTTTPVKKAVKK